MFRYLFVTISLLPLIGACSRQQEESGAAREPAAPPQATSEAQTAEISFAQVLDLQGVSFHLASPNWASANTITVSTAGLENDKSAWSQDVDGIITGAEVTDLNVDGSPEVYVYVRSIGADEEGSVIAYVANNRKSLSMAFTAPLSDTPGAADGHRGRDEFAVLEGVLGRRFPIHDEAGAPTGKVRQLHYTLEAGEAGWILKVDRILEF